MARVSLILPLSPGASPPSDWIHDVRRGLEGVGHSVEVVEVSDPRSPNEPGTPRSWRRSLVSTRPGLTSAAVAGLGEADGDVLVVLDPGRGYSAQDVERVIDPLVQEEAELAVGRRGVGKKGVRGLVASGVGTLARRLIGTGDPLSGLVAMTPHLARRADFAPIGSFFALELLTRTDGRRVDVPVGPVARASLKGVAIDDVRHLKRLADHRFGNLSRLIQFCAVGASGMVIDLSCYALFQWVFSRTSLAAMTAPMVGGSLALAASAALAIAVALTWNFSLNRRLTFNYARQGSLVRQFVAYALSNAVGIGLSFTLRLFLPSHIAFFHRHRLAAAVVGIVAATGISFSMSRWLVFRHRGAVVDQPEPQPCPTRINSVGHARGEDLSTPHMISRACVSSQCDPL